MREMNDKVARCLSWIAIIIAIVAFLLSMWRWKEFEANTATIVIAVLALVVTIYMIIHVWNEITLEQEVTRKVIKKFDKKIESVVNHQMYLAFFFQGVNNEDRSQVEAALYFYIKSLECLAKTDIDQDKYEEVLMKVERLVKKYPATQIDKNEKEQYIDTIADLKYSFRKRIETALDTLIIRTV